MTFRLCCSGTGSMAMALNTKGIMEQWLTWYFSITGQNLEAENFGISTAVPPTPSAPQKAQLWQLT